MTYEYVCTSCGVEWEAEQPISAPPLQDCPKCGERTAKRQISGGAGFILKGGGWYADGYGTVQPKSGADASKGGESKADSKSDAKSDSKSEPKPETKSEPKGESKDPKGSPTSSQAA